MESVCSHFCGVIGTHDTNNVNRGLVEIENGSKKTPISTIIKDTTSREPTPFSLPRRGWITSPKDFGETDIQSSKSMCILVKL